jgi:hypothetical protein
LFRQELEKLKPGVIDVVVFAAGDQLDVDAI